MQERKPIAYIVRGCYVHPECSRSVSHGYPVYSEDLPSLVWCRACEDQILPEPCVFCEIIAGRAPAQWIVMPETWPDAVAFEPLDQISEGHCLIAPKRHVKDFASDPEVFAATARRAAELMQWTQRPMVILSTRGKAAGQQVMHLHLHLIPREEGDGIRLVSRKGKK